MDEYLESQEEDPVIKGIGDEWIWCPQSTAIFHPKSSDFDKKYKAWDHVSFAFLIPEDCKGIRIPDEDWGELIGQVSIHDVQQYTNLSPDKSSDTKYEAIIKYLKPPNKLPNHLHRALIYRFKEYYEELVRHDKYGCENKIKGHDEAIERLNIAIAKERLAAEEDMEEDIPAAAIKQKLFN